MSRIRSFGISRKTPYSVGVYNSLGEPCFFGQQPSLCNDSCNAVALGPPIVLRAKVVAVLNGGTLVVADSDMRRIVRLAGTKAPTKNEDFGNESKDFLSRLVMGKQVALAQVNSSQEEPMFCTVTLDHRNINAMMIKAGMARHWPLYCQANNLLKLEQEAQEMRVGIWQ
ncbi:MAG: thermonuclease family protein [Planctomycetota bacterium]